MLEVAGDGLVRLSVDVHDMSWLVVSTCCDILAIRCNTNEERVIEILTLIEPHQVPLRIVSDLSRVQWLTVITILGALGHAQIPKLHVEIVTWDDHMRISAALRRHELSILHYRKLLVEDVRSGRQGLLIIRHELQRGPVVEGRFLPVVTDVNETLTRSVEEHRASLGRLRRGDPLIVTTFVIVEDVVHVLSARLLPGLELIIQVEDVDTALIRDDEVLVVWEQWHGVDVLLVSIPEGANVFTFRWLADGLDLWDWKSLALLNLLLDAFKLVDLLDDNLEKLDGAIVAAEEHGLLSSLIDPLQSSDRLIDLCRSQDIEALAVCLELCHVLEFRPSFFVVLLLKADDTSSAVTNRQDLPSCIKGYSWE